MNSYPRWKCFIKGISTTHVIITLLPASEKDVRLFMSSSYIEDFLASNSPERSPESVIFNADYGEKYSNTKVSTPNVNMTDHSPLKSNESKLCGRYSESSAKETDTDRRSQDFDESLVIPVYVYDCSLALLIDTLVDKLKVPHSRDIYQDHTFRIGQEECKDFIELKSDYTSKPSTPEPKSEESDNTQNGR